MRVAVLGGGNGSFAAAGDFALRGHDVRLWRRDKAPVADQLARGSTVSVKDAKGTHEARLALVTDDIAKAVDGAELIFCPAPATSHHEIAAALAPCLQSDQVVFLAPGTLGSIIFAHAAASNGRAKTVCFAETGTLPWLARKHGPYDVAITTRATRLPVGVFPAQRQDHALAVISKAFPNVIEPCGDALSGALMNAGPIIHPPLILMNAGPLEHFDRWDIHNEGTQPSIRHVTDLLDRERIAVRQGLGYGAPHFPLADHYKEDGDEWMYGRRSHNQLTKSGDWREHIDLRTHRYMREDTLLGLSLLVSVAQLASVDTPLARSFLTLGAAVCDFDAAAEGRTLARLALGAYDRAGLQHYLRTGTA
jgi:opine dehydrogenase